MSSRVLDSSDRRLLVDRITGHPKLATVVAQLPPAALHGLVRAMGLEDAGAILVHATADQLTRVFDEDLWAAPSFGNDEFDPSRFGTWLDVLVDADPGVAARALTGLDRDFVAGALSHHMLVVERAWIATGAAFVDPDVSARGRAAIRALLDEGLTIELGALLVIGTSRHSWDAVVAVLLALHEVDEEAFHDILSRCGKATFTWLAAAGWTVLHERVALPAARQLRDALADLRIDDRALALQAAETRARLERSIARGVTWEVRPHLDVVSVLDPVSWFVLSALLDECPAIPPSLYSPMSSAAVMRVTTDLAFIAENAQVAWANAYIASLPARLVG